MHSRSLDEPMTAPETAAGASLWLNMRERVIVPGMLLAVFSEVGVMTKPVLGEGYASLIFVLGITLIGARAGLATAVISASVSAGVSGSISKTRRPNQGNRSSSVPVSARWTSGSKTRASSPANCSRDPTAVLMVTT